LNCGSSSDSLSAAARSRRAARKSGSAIAALVALANRTLHLQLAISLFISNAYSIGSSFVIGSMNPLTISFEASSSAMPCDIR